MESKHTLRKVLIKTILVWAAVFISILGVIFIFTVNSLADYMLSEIAKNRMNYQVEEFAKHLGENDQKSIHEESEALIQDRILSGIIVIDSSGVIVHVSLHEDGSEVLNISPETNIMEMRKAVHSIGHLRLYEGAIPGYKSTLAIIMDKRPVLRDIYASTLWTAFLLLCLLGISVLRLYYSLKRYLIDPVEDVKRVIDNNLSDEAREETVSHLPDEVADLACSYEGSHKAHMLAEESLRNSEFFLKETQKVANLGTYTLTLSTGKWTSSPIMDEIFGIDDNYPKDIPGWLNLVHPDDREEMNSYLAENVILKHESFDKEYRIIKHSNNKERWLHGLGMLKFDADNNLVEMVGTIQDITDRKEIERQLNQSQKMEALGRLVGGVAHDFNNILAGVTGNLYLIKKKMEEYPEVLSRLVSIEQLAFRAAGLINQMLIFARKGVVIKKPMSFTSFTKDTLNLLHVSTPENIDLRQNICSDELWINGDMTQLQQVLMNLTSNARDAVQYVDHPYININLETFNTDAHFIKEHKYFNAGSYAHLSVEDNGCGISKAQKKQLFEPFYTTKEVGKGTGLGLSMVFGAIKTHDGFVEVESTENKGSTFHVFIPLLESDGIDSTSKQQGGIFEGNGKTILFVDDEESVLQAGTLVLESLGYQVLQASNGVEAINVFSNNKEQISLIIMDVVMPKLGGVKAVERVKKIQPDVKVIFSTGYDMHGTLGDLMPSTSESVLTKPFTVEQLSKAIESKLDL